MKNRTLVHLVILTGLLAAAMWLNWSTVQQEEPMPLGSAPDTYVLALTWQPAFCETAPRRPECRSQHGDRFDSGNFSLHGLWPQPFGNFYCNVPAQHERLSRAGRWHELPKLDLPEDLRKTLSVKMPGYRSGLHRHEWIKHGTCMKGATPETYFRVSLALLDAFNASTTAELFRSRIGTRTGADQIRRSLATSFGSGAEDRVSIECSRDGARRLIRELRLSLGAIRGTTPQLATLLAAGEPVPRSCPAGLVDAHGLQ